MGHRKHTVHKNVGLLHTGSSLNVHGGIWRVSSSFSLNSPLVH